MLEDDAVFRNSVRVPHPTHPALVRKKYRRSKTTNTGKINNNR